MATPPPIDATVTHADERMHATQESIHSHCVVCGSRNSLGLHLQFSACPDGGVQAEFSCPRPYEGYPDTLHGGIICALLDGAMTNCLFALGRSALTAELRVRFLRPVAIGRRVTVRAWVENAHRPLFYLAAELRQDDEIVATGRAKFMERKPPLDDRSRSVGSLAAQDVGGRS